ncbi:MAG TPA: hypothetical protein VD794_05865 [Flavisolibacter sp.]|nr:hypothetical protein [Flavisolibacter sp.]
MELKQYASKVQEMRNAQKSFFKAARAGNVSQKTAALELSKKLESEVNALTLEAINSDQPKQQSMF